MTNLKIKCLNQFSDRPNGAESLIALLKLFSIIHDWQEFNDNQRSNAYMYVRTLKHILTNQNIIEDIQSNQELAEYVLEYVMCLL